MQPSLPLPGDVVWIRQRRWRVERASRHHDVLRLDVSARETRLTFLAPFDRPATVVQSERVRRVRRRSALVRVAHLLSRTHGVRTLLSAVGAEVSLLPHQLEPALAIVTDGARRVLLADEVGLGKTIQAGLVIAELVRRLTAPHILIVVPATLIEQWRDELSRRFHISTEAATRGSIEQIVRRGGRGDNPWNRAGVWLASLDYLKQAYVLAALPVRPWDLVVFDEAHAAAGDSDRHVAAQTIARRARRLMLLTATPHDGDEKRFRRLVELGDMNDDLTVFRRTRTDIRSGGTRHVRWPALSPSPEEVRVLDTLVAFERAVLSAAGAARRDAALLLLAVLRKRALSTMGALAISLERRQAWIEGQQAAESEWTQPSLFFEDGAHDDVGADETGALSADVGLDRRRERTWLKRLRTLTDAARRHERKARHLTCLLRRSAEPVVIFTEFRHSLDALRASLESIRVVSVLHGGQTEPERTRELKRFLDGAASVLLATDVAGLGLNLQSRSRWVVSVELPWNPARLEQRLGRVDRIGQARPVHFTVLTSRHAAESAVVARLARRTMLARHAFGDDVLRACAPDAAAIRESILAGDSLDLHTAPSRSIAICRRWQRHGPAAARSLALRRQLARSWRSPMPDRGRTRVARIGASHTICVFTVPILDSAGNVLEEHAVAIRIPPGPLATADHHRQVGAARTLACRATMPRLARVRRWQRSQQQRGSVRDSAIAAALTEMLRPDETQPGLFDRRAVNVFEISQRNAAEFSADEAARSASRESFASAEIGRPHLAVMLT